MDLQLRGTIVYNYSLVTLAQGLVLLLSNMNKFT